MADDKSPQWDVFISHASEDNDFVQPLVVSLGHLGVKVWYDEINLSLGDDLTRSIDEGLAQSRFGLIVISKHFLEKQWTDYELRGLLSREIGTASKVVIPIWHGVTLEDVLKFSPSLAGKYAHDTSKIKVEELLLEIVKVVRPDIYQQHPRAELERIMRGEELEKLKAEIGALEEKLEESKHLLEGFTCPTCKAPLVSKFGNDEIEIEEYECGYTVSDSPSSNVPCPSDPKFPKLDEYKLVTTQHDNNKNWLCSPQPKTANAKTLHLGAQWGRTKEDAEKMVKSAYERAARPWSGYSW